MEVCIFSCGNCFQCLTDLINYDQAFVAPDCHSRVFFTSGQVVMPHKSVEQYLLIYFHFLSGKNFILPNMTFNISDVAYVLIN